ncbi:MAG: STAS domain-containing protein [Synechococcales bacterium]|nr:STAS domain-containing protein [Synechococcales bacterium]
MSNVLQKAEISLIEPTGHINAANSELFKQQLTEAVAKADASPLVVDMSGVESLDSAGLMALVSALSAAQTLNRKFLICSVPAPIRIIFELTQLDQVFEIINERPTPMAIAA